MQALLPLLALLVGLVATWRGGRYALTAPAERVAGGPPPAWGGPGPATDGVAVWADWLPLPRAVLPGDPALAHTVERALWGALLVAVYGLGRRLGLSRLQATAAAVLLAAHPACVALHVDVAGGGVLLATLAMVAALAVGLGPAPAGVAGRAAVAGGATALLAAGLLSHPLAAWLPLVLALALWRRERLAAPERPAASRLRALWPALGPALAVLAWMVARGRLVGDVAVDPAVNLALGPDGEVPLASGLALAGRAVAAGLVGWPVLRQPWELALPAGVGSGAAWLGALALVGLPVAARLARSPGVSVGLWWAFAALLGLSQLADPLPSTQAPALLAMGLVGPALAVGSLVRGRAALGAVVAAAAVVAALPTGRVAAAWTAEEPLLAWEAAHAPGVPAPRLALAERRLARGDAEGALDAVDGLPPASAGAVRVRANLLLQRWGTARQLLGSVTGDERDVLACELAAASREVGAVRRCQEARARLGDAPRLVAALGRALRAANRVPEAEALLRGALAERPRDLRLLEALADLLEGVGWMREATEVLEAWLDASGGDRRVRERLGRALERKGRGDLLEGRAEEAAAAFERALALDPGRHALRFLLADAYAALGRGEEAEAQRAEARRHGATPPPPPDAVPGLPLPPAGHAPHQHPGGPRLAP